MPKVTPAHEQQRRAQILAAAMSCFSRQGYRATAMDDVVRESGLSVGAIYSYFPSKEDLFLALSDDRAQHTLVYLNQVFRGDDSMDRKVREAIDYFFTLLSDELIPLARVNLEFISEAAKSERIQARQIARCDAIRMFVCGILNDAQQRGEVRPDADIAATAELLIALHEGIVAMTVAGLRQISLDALKAAYLALLNGIL